MKFSFLKYVLVSLVFALSIPAMAQSTWVEGTHYTVISDKASDEKKIREVFSYWCPACNSFESIVTALKPRLPADVEFIKAHVNFLGGASQDTQDDATRGMLAAKAMKDDARYNEALFNAIHRDRKKIESMDDILGVYAAAGGDSAKLEKLAKSFGIRSKVAKNNKLTQGIRSVPTFIVNDKYQATFTRDMNADSIIELLLWLTTQK